MSMIKKILKWHSQLSFFERMRIAIIVLIIGLVFQLISIILQMMER